MNLSGVMRPALAAIFLGVLSLVPAAARAERYLTIPEAQRLCFPQASQFDEKSFRLGRDQVERIEKKSKVKVRKASCRYWLAQRGTNLLGVLLFDQVLGKHELIDYAVAVSPDGRILQVEILEYREHYGDQIRQSKWRDQFTGKTGSARFRLNDDVYNISGATISCRNVTDGINRVLATYELVVRPQLVAAGRLSGANDSAPKP
jgi:Na+-translocating ferredoxin:NAD+ oxidoreductase RnfG subunit